MQEILYGTGYLDLKPVVSQADTKLLQTTPTLVAGDFKVRNAVQAFTNLTAVAAAFTSGSVAPVVGETLTGDTSTKTAIVVGWFLTSGSWSGTDGAGTLFVASASGAFTVGETISGSVGGSNILTLTANFVAQPTALAQTGSGGGAIPITAAEATTDRLSVARVDAAGAEWCSDWLEYITTDHPSAGKPNGCIASVAAHASSQTSTNIRLNAAPQATPIAGFFVVATAVGSSAMFGVIKSYSTAGGEFNITLYEAMPAAVTSAWTIAVYGDAAAAAARVIASENIDFTTTQKTYVPTTTAKTTLDLHMGIMDQSTGQLDLGSLAAEVLARLLAAAGGTKLDLFAAILDPATGQLDEGSVAEPLKANVKEINDVTIDGAGTAGDPWGAA